MSGSAAAAATTGGMPITEDDEGGARPTALLSISNLLRISLYWLGLTAIDSGVAKFISFRLAYSDLKGDLGVGTATALLAIGGALVAILVQPTVGTISDYTSSRWGRRKPYIVIGSVLDVFFLLGIATSNTLLAITAFIILLQFSTNTARGPFQGYVPDLIAEPQVGMASAMVGLMQVAGNITGTLLVAAAAITHNLPLAIGIIAVIELVTMASVVLRVGKGLPPRDRHGRGWVSIAKEAWGTDILRERSYVYFVASRLFFLVAGGIVFAFDVQYMKNVFALTQEDAGRLEIVLLVTIAASTLISIVPASRMSDRIGRKPVIYGACAVGAVGVAIVALAPVIPVVVVGAALFGAASGTFISVDWALLTDIIPRVSAGRYMGLSNVANGSAPLFAAVIGGIVLDVVGGATTDAIGARTAFLVAVVLYGVAALLLRPVTDPQRDRAMLAAQAAAAA
jgi:MFS family permease